MKYTEVLHGQEARDALRRGVEAVALPVKKTMGAKGRNGVYREYGVPKVTNDGVSIARKVSPKDPFECLGADMVKDAAEKTNTEAGDGTTTSVVLAQAIIEEGYKEGGDPMELRRRIEADKDKAVRLIKEMARPVVSTEDIKNIARISVEDESMAQIVTDATEKAGKYGAIIVEEGAGVGIETDISKGYFWDRGFVSPYMITNPDRNEAVLENTMVIVTDKYMNLNRDLMPVLNDLLQSGVTSALVIADRIEGELLASLIANKVKSIFTTVAVQRPSSDDELRDIATLVNGTAITKDLGIKQIQRPHVGRAKKVIVSKDRTTIVADETPALAELVERLSNELKECEDELKRDMLKARIAKLTDGIVVLRVGAKTETERTYKKLKIDDAVAACRAATQEGYVEGAGVTLLKVAEQMDTAVMRNALCAPYKTILENAGIPVTGDGAVYDVRTGERVSDLIASGIIDPAKVERCAVENAVSLATSLLTIESVIVEREEIRNTSSY